MWIEEKTNAKGTRYIFTERYTNPTTKKTFKVSVTLNSKSRHAQKEAARILLEKYRERTITIDERIAAKLETLTISDVCHEWVEATAPSVKEQTTIARRTCLKRLFMVLAPTTLFLDFTPSIWEATLYKLYYKQGVSTQYAALILTTVRQVLKYAKKSRYLDDIRDFEDIKLKKKPLTPSELDKKRNKFLNRDELRQCLSQLKAKNTRIAYAMEFIALTGLRCGELLALRVQDYDTQTHIIHVNGNMIQHTGISVDERRTTPKNIYSYRDVYINQRAREILQWFMIENRKMALWYSRKYKEQGYIFTSYTGNPYTYSAIQAVLRPITINGKRITSHVFRHTHISMLAENGTPLKAIMLRVGHNNPNTTLSIYTHVTNAMDELTRKKVDSLAL